MKATKDLEWLTGGGELERLIRAYDWSTTPLGPLENWPLSLRTSVSLMLNSRHPMWIGWGPDITFLYNDAYISVLGAAKHPWALGRPTREVWAEIWDGVGPMIDKVFAKGEPSFADGMQLFMRRGALLEEVYYSFSYSPIRDESGKVAGLFCPSAETTSAVLTARRLRTLSALSANALVEKTVERAQTSAIETLARNAEDVPFAVLYLLSEDGREAHRVALTGLDPSHTHLAPKRVDLTSGEVGPWPMLAVARQGQLAVVPVPPGPDGPTGLAQQKVTSVVVLPVSARSGDRPLGLLIAGVNPTRRVDGEYRTFYELMAGQIATAVQNARSVEEDRKRAEELAELDRAKTVFFSNVSHEFRTPLTLMLGPLEEELRERPDDNERVEVAYRNSLRLLKLVNALLDFSRIEAGRIDASYEPTDLATYTTELASVFRSTVEKAGLRFLVRCAPLSEPVCIDRDMWEKIVFNFLSNAFKFTFQGEIEVSVWQQDAQTAGFSVRDTGAGVPAAELPRLFERFHRVKSTRSRSFEGTGIGLALVQELVRLHGGSLSAASEEGKGTTFTVLLPLGTAHLPPERIRPARELPPAAKGAAAFLEEADRWLSPGQLDRGEVPRSVTSGAEPAQVGTAGTRGWILLADDNHDMREYVRRLLTARGHEVTTVADGQAALEVARVRRPSLVLSDVMMPRLDGFGLLKALRADPELHMIPIILLSARAGEEARIEGVKAGADDYLTKPFSARELIARVEGHLELARVRREAAAAVEAERRRLYELLMLSPALIAVLQGPRHVVELGNDPWLAALGRERADVLGKPLQEAVPELIAQGFIEILDGVYRTGVAYSARDAEADLQEPGGKGLRPHYFNFVYQPIRTPEGVVDGILVHAIDVTKERVAENDLKYANRLLADRATHLDALVLERTARLRETIGELEAFSYSVAHDLRAPLRSLQGFSDVLLAEHAKHLDPEAQGFLRRIAASAERMDKLIQDVLTYSRVVRGASALEPVDLDKLARGIVETYPDFAPDRAHIELVGPLPTLLGNEAMLTQIISNLLGNAVKFVAPNQQPRIRLYAERTGSRLRLCFQDNGIGIPADQLGKIFEIFHQVDNHRGGTGIGLAIVKKAAERLGGMVGVNSVVGQGSTFWIELPA